VFTGHCICFVVGHLKYQSTSVRPTPCICGTLKTLAVRWFEAHRALQRCGRVQNMGTHTHKKNAPRSVTIGILTVSTTRSLQTDESGKWIEGQASNSGHSVCCRKIVPDDAVHIAETVSAVIRGHHPQVLIITGGTGITPEDVTI
jgi:hypothetical protein